MASATQNVNGYLRISATRDEILVESIGLKKAAESEKAGGDAPEVLSWVMDCVSLHAPANKVQ